MLDIVYYTDPLCCWSWAFEPVWRRLRYEYSDEISYRYCMGGLLPGWKNYNDSVNSVTRPAQMGPVWMHAQQLSGMPIQPDIWMRDPPASSYPACMAVKCAGLQSADAGEVFLRCLREAIMIRSANITNKEVLLIIAEEVAAIIPAFDPDRFRLDLAGDVALEAFRKDLLEVQHHNISRFPTLLVKNKNKQAILIAGYRPYNVLLQSLRKLSSLENKATINQDHYKKHWPSITEREMEEVVES